MSNKHYYGFIYDIDKISWVEATDIKEAISKFFIYYTGYNELFDLAIKGIEDIEQLIKLHNHFAYNVDYRIDGVIYSPQWLFESENINIIP